jgi:hypothetical protein
MGRQVSFAGLYAAPSAKKSDAEPPPQTSISSPVHAAENVARPAMGEGARRRQEFDVGL